MPGALKVCSTALPPGLRVSSTLQLALVDVSECVWDAWSNSQRTVVPVGTVAVEGCHAWAR